VRTLNLNFHFIQNTFLNQYLVCLLCLVFCFPKEMCSCNTGYKTHPQRHHRKYSVLSKMHSFILCTKVTKITCNSRGIQRTKSIFNGRRRTLTNWRARRDEKKQSTTSYALYFAFYLWVYLCSSASVCK